MTESAKKWSKNDFCEFAFSPGIHAFGNFLGFFRKTREIRRTSRRALRLRAIQVRLRSEQNVKGGTHAQFRDASYKGFENAENAIRV